MNRLENNVKNLNLIPGGSEFTVELNDGTILKSEDCSNLEKFTVDNGMRIAFGLKPLEFEKSIYNPDFKISEKQGE